MTRTPVDPEIGVGSERDVDEPEANPDPPRLLTRRDIVAMLDRDSLAPRRSLGQNFVVDPNTIRRIVRLAEVGPGDHVVEVGAGLGSLTLGLAATGARVTAIEIDRGLVASLRSTMAGSQTEIVEADARTVAWDRFLSGPATLVANLPYNVATPLVADLLDDEPRLRRMLVMVQREVADRLVADAGTAAFGAVSVKVAHWSIARMVATVGRDVFLPRPNVSSALIEIVRRDEPFTRADPDVLFSLVRRAFGQRRKMLRRSLAGVVEHATFTEAGIDPTARPEEIDVGRWGRLALAHAARSSAVPEADDDPDRRP